MILIFMFLPDFKGEISLVAEALLRKSGVRQHKDTILRT